MTLARISALRKKMSRNSRIPFLFGRILGGRGLHLCLQWTQKQQPTPLLHLFLRQFRFLTVRDRGVNYDPPTSHLGNPIVSSVISISELTILYLGNKIHEGETRLGQPKPD